MTNKQTRVLHLLATGIAIELILAVAFIIGHGHSEQWVSTKNHAFAVADEPSPMEGRPENGALGMNDPTGAETGGEGSAQDNSSGDPASIGAFGNFDDADTESSDWDGGLLDDNSAAADDGNVFSYGGDPNAWDPFAGVEAGAYPAPDPGGFSGSFPPPSSSDGLSGDELGGWDGRGLPPHMGPPSMPDDPRDEDWPTEVPTAETPEGETPAATSPAQTPVNPTAGTPSATLPASTLPAATKPAATATRPAATQPAPTQPAPTLPATTQPPAQPTATQPEAQPTSTSTPVPPTPEPAMPEGLVSMPVSAAPNLDGSGADAAWASAPAVTIQTSGGANQSAARVSVQSVYDGQNVYFLLRWDDPSRSFQFHPWEKQADGSWQMLASAQHNDENAYYEDQLAIIWPAVDGGGQVLDLWQWQSVRGAGQADDLYQNGSSNSGRYPPSGGQPDPSSGGGYRFNISENQASPAFMLPDGGSRDGAPGFIREDEKQTFDDSLFQAGERVPGIISAPWQGDRGDISAAAGYENGGWTLELRRARITGSPYDVQFDNLDRVYAFGLATFDNTQQRYAAQNGLMAFMFRD